MFHFQLQEILEGPRGDPGHPLSVKGQGSFLWVLCHSLSANDKCVGAGHTHLPGLGKVPGVGLSL